MATRRHFDYGLEPGRKKDDDSPSKSAAGRLPMFRSLRKRRIALALLSIWLIYVLVKNIHVLPVSQANVPGHGLRNTRWYDEVSNEQYNGPIRYFQLSQSLQSFVKQAPSQDAVLFVFAHPEAASHVVDSACLMASQKRAVVHVAAMGQHSIDLSSILQVNGFSSSDCPIYLHDAQIDFAAQSSRGRLQRGVEGAFGHLYRTLWLQAVFYDGSRQEAEYLQASIVNSARRYGVTSISVPTKDAWMLELDPSSLREWHKVQVDIVIRVTSESAGSLLRLLRSIQGAEYGDLAHPSIALELPPRTDMAVLRHLTTFAWPPKARPAGSRLIIRHRVSDAALTPAAASLQIVESFYPTTASSHVLILAPEAELAQNWYQMLIFLILECRHSQQRYLLPNTMGISLQGLTSTGTPANSISLTQRLDGRADLFFDPLLSKSVESVKGSDSDLAPWLRLARELMRSQGYSMIQLSASNRTSPLAVLHDDRPLLEEQLTESSNDADEAPMLKTEGTALVSQYLPHEIETELQLVKESVLGLVKGGMWEAMNNGGLIQDAYGASVDRVEIFKQAQDFARRFSQEVWSQCSAELPSIVGGVLDFMADRHGALASSLAVAKFQKD
ncbi:uncharacterized protein AB675_11001 [Cyphellophora attinorum]|uniref:Uncharacterized protein n=1 Tax=Cyphellophora attinorum TaxID=1664694 RepID=A0A0N0NI84_9EURO|nr:uncharacterized protein AB675_11001 [Phialophora attinorum]KPI35541.1 hypothetical protein AB675_11001 [Phialophora attinorum]